MPSDALTYKHIANELDELLKGGSISKITMPSNDTVILSVYNNFKNYSLLLSCNPTRPKIYITSESFENPENAPSFLMHLRKHIKGAKIQGITPLPFDRIISIDLLTSNELRLSEQKILSIELINKRANIILINADKTISDCIRKVSPDINGKNAVLPAFKYSYEDERINPDNYTEKGIQRLLATFEGGNLATFIQSNVIGLSKESANDAIFKVFLTLNPVDFSAEKMQLLAKNLFLLLNESLLNPCVRIADSRAVDFYFRPYSQYDKNDYIFFDKLNNAVDYFFVNSNETSRLKLLSVRLENAVRSAINKAEKRLATLIEKENDCADFEKDRLFGELITANIYRLKKGMKSFLAENYYEEGSENVLIALDENLSAQGNAQRFFKLYNKKKKTIEALKEQLKKVRDELSYLESVLLSIKLFETEENLQEIKRELINSQILKNDKKTKNKKLKDTPLSLKEVFISGYKILIGKNNIQNDFIVKNARSFDLWLHIKDNYGSHVLIENKSLEFPPDEVILKAASLAGFYSKARFADKTAVDYTFARNVSKPSGVALGKVIYTNQYTVFVKPSDV